EAPSVTLIVENVDRLSLSGQAELLDFLENEESKFGTCRLLTTARDDMLEKVYQGELLESLYYKLATLKLTLRPLRERREDVPAIASWFGEFYANHLGLGDVTLSAGANERLSNYIWFGNLNEMETVIARTMALQRKNWIEAVDLIFDFSVAGELPELPAFKELVRSEAQEKGELERAENLTDARAG